jgi:hypothetical protein
MRAPKTFDCVEMKNAIQARRRQEYEGLTDDEIRRRIQDKLSTSDDIVARKWRRIAEREKTSTVASN